MREEKVSGGEPIDTTPPPPADTPDDPAAIGYMAMRQALGWIGLALPFVLLGFGLHIHGDIFTSISAYYYTALREVLVGSLVTIGIFLWAYVGYPKKPGEWFSDNQVAWAAGVGAIGVAFFPTTVDCMNTIGDVPTMGLRTSCQVPFDKEPFRALLSEDPDAYQAYLGWFNQQIVTPELIGAIHIGSAVLFFAAIAWMCLFHFTRESVNHPDTLMSDLKNWRRKVFKICGYGMLGVLALIIAEFALHKTLPDAVHALRPVFWLESFAVLFFGVAWLVKGRQLIDDREGKVSRFTAGIAKRFAGSLEAK